MVVEVLEVCTEDGAQPRCWVPWTCGRRGDRVGERLERRLQQEREHIVLAGEVVVERRPRHTSGGGDVGHLEVIEGRQQTVGRLLQPSGHVDRHVASGCARGWLDPHASASSTGVDTELDTMSILFVRFVRCWAIAPRLFSRRPLLYCAPQLGCISPSTGRLSSAPLPLSAGAGR